MILGDPSRDYGGLITRVPARVLRPRTVEELADQVRGLRTDGVPWVARGAGHSSGGQALIAGGVVIELTQLARIVADDGDRVTVEAGLTWFRLVEYLARDHRRPPVLTDQLGATIGGTLSVGGVGDTSHQLGLQIDHVHTLDLVTPAGDLETLRPSDPRFPFVLAGHGQLGVIARVTLAVRAWPATIAVRVFEYPSLPAYLAAVARGGYAFVRGRMFYRRGEPHLVRAVIGTPSPSLDAAPPAMHGDAVMATEPELVDLVEHARGQPPLAAELAPATEVALPLTRALAMWEPLDELIKRADLPVALRDGVSVSVVAPGGLPLSPCAFGTDAALVVALRPRFTDEVVARRVAGWLRSFAARALSSGARLYPIGEEPDDVRWASLQYASVWADWTAWKTRLDPDRRCHPWRL